MAGPTSSSVKGHGYGLYWLEQAGTTAAPRWIRHTIDESFSQSHALLLADLDGDGTPELITGKRYRGHSGADPGSYDPVVLYAYRLPSQAAIRAMPKDGKTRTTPKPTMVLADPASDPMWDAHRPVCERHSQRWHTDPCR